MRKVFHVEFKGNNIPQRDRHKYYGSKTALLLENKKRLPSSRTFDRHDWSKPYENEYFIIRDGFIITSGDVRKARKLLRPK